MKRKRKAPSQQATKLSQHIGELRWRFFACAVAFAIGGAITYVLRDQVFQLIQLPLNTPLYYTTPAGSFSFVMRFCAIGAALAVVPMLAYHLIMFIRPAFSASISRKRVYITSLLSLFLAGAGMAFGFGFIIPAALHFFAGFQLEGLESLLSADSYLSFVTNVLIMFAIAFQLPLVISFIDHIKPLKPSSLLKMEKWVILSSLLISVFMPFAWDLTSSLLIAAPVVVLYNISIIIVLIQHAMTRSKQSLRARTSKRTESILETTPSYTDKPDVPKTAEEPIPEAPTLAPMHTVAAEAVVEMPTPSADKVAPSHPKAMDILPSPTARRAPQLVPPRREVETPLIVPVSRDQLIRDIVPRASTI